MKHLMEKKIVIFGIGTVQQILESRYPELPVVAYADNNPQKQGTQYLGRPVLSPEAIRSIWAEDMAIVVGSSNFNEISQQLDHLGFNCEGDYFDGMDFLTEEEFRSIVPFDPDGFAESTP